MSASVLVAYATRYGSTAEVAGAIATTLQDHLAMEVDLLPVKEVTSVEGYRAVVVGAPLYIGAWSHEVRDFLSCNRKALTERPVAVFVLGPLSEDPNEMEAARAQVEKELAAFPWLNPVALEIFIGKYDPATLRFPENLLTFFPATPLYRLPASDRRNWAAIRAWAKTLATYFQPVPME